MITYKEFIEKMQENGYVYNDNPVSISNNIADNKIFSENIFSVGKGLTGKIIQFDCPKNQIIALCGSTHLGGCDRSYPCFIKCYNNQGNEPFQGLHHSTELTKNQHVIAEIIVTKILRNDPPIQYEKVKEWSEKINPILKLIGSTNNREHVMWVGAYNVFDSEFNKNSFTLYGGQKITFYINRPDIDITRTEFEFNVDVFESTINAYHAKF